MDVFFETEGFVDREATCGPPQELAALGIQGLDPTAFEVIFRTPEAIFLRLKALWVVKRPAALRRSYIDAKRLVI